MSEEISVEIKYSRKYNLGNYQTKDYEIKLAGTESQLTEGLAEKSAKLQGFIENLETLVELAHEANQLKARIPKPAVDQTPVAGNGGPN